HRLVERAHLLLGGRPAVDANAATLARCGRRTGLRGLRTDRGRPGPDVQPGSRAEQAGIGRHCGAADRRRDRGYRKRPQGARAGRAGRDPRARPPVHGWLPQPSRGSRRSAARRLDLHRRHRRARRRRLPVHPRPQEGHGDRRRLQRLSARGRRGAVPASRRDRRRSGRHPRRLSWRSAARAGRAAARRPHPARRARRALRGEPGALQGAGAPRDRRRAAQDLGEQDRQERDPAIAGRSHGTTRLMEKTLKNRFANPLLQPPAWPMPRRVAIIGAGSIGPDIGYYLKSALPSLALTLIDLQQPALDAALARFRGYADKAVARGKMKPADAQAVLADVSASTDYDAIAGCDWVLAAATENLALKRRIFADVEARISPDAIITSNTSSLPAARIFSELRHPRRATVTHFFAPAWRNPAVEVIDWPQADPALVAHLRRLFCETGKLPLVTADAPCFMLDRIFDNWCNESALLLDRATASDIDSVAADYVHAGPFFVLNLARGNPIIVETNTLQADEEGEHYRPAPIFRS